ncbi:hypothetical protein WR25_04386 isoform C [Diploscapter pachys]|nr:hypothetical protein WR25_04386 isoform C [Diploscapter pachys]
MSYDDDVNIPKEKDEDGKLENVMQLFPVHNFAINQRIMPKCMISAILEPNGQERLVMVSASNKVLVKDTEISLHIPDKIRCIDAAPLGTKYDLIIIGTESQVIVFDVYQNTTVFQRDIPDGVNCFAIGILADFKTSLVICGGNCAIWGFDPTGKDVYWTVTGDVVNAMCLCDYDNDGELELIVGSPDFEIRIFKRDLMRTELTETDAVIGLAAVTNNCFAYALSNGTIGVYKGEERLWRIKSKNIATSMLRFPSDNLMTAIWNTGKIDIRQVTTGEVATKDQPQTSLNIVGACLASLTDPNQKAIVIVTGEGKVTGYELRESKELVDRTPEIIREFGQKKHNLMMELSNFEQEDQMTEAEKGKEQRIPINTVVNSLYYVNKDERTLNLVLEASNEVCIRAVVIFAEGMFEGESHIWIPTKIEGNGDKVTIPLIPEKDVQNDLHIKALLGQIDSAKLHVFEMSRLIPQFARFAFMSNTEDWEKPKPYVEFALKQRNQRIFDWVQESFVIDVAAAEFDSEARKLEMKFIGLASKKRTHLGIYYSNDDNKMQIYHDDMETVGTMVQSIVAYFQVQSLESRAVFPAEFKEAEDIIAEMESMYDVKDKLTAELTEKQSLVKETIVRAEDAIHIDQM